MMKQRLHVFTDKFDLNSGFQYWALAAITLLAAALRFYKLGEWSFWIDEIFTINRAQIHYSTIERIIQNIPPERNWVPVSVILTAGVLNGLGVSEWSARLVSVVIGVVSIPVLYFPVKRLFGSATALMAALLLAVSTWHLYWSQNARFYTALMLFYTLALLALFYGLERDRLRYILLFMVFSYLAMSERLFAIVMGPVIVVYLLLLALLPFEKPAGFRPKNLALILLPGVAFGFIELYSLVAQGESRFFGDFDWFFLYRTDDPFRMLAFISFNIGIPLMSLAAFGGLYLLAQKNRAGLFVFVAAALPVGLLLALNPFIFTQDRYVFMTLFSWIILGAVAVREIMSQMRYPGKLLAVGLAVLLLADAGGANLLYYQVNNGNRRDWKGAFTLIQERSQPDDLVVTYWPELGNYYLDQEMIFWPEIGPDTVVQGGKRVWFVIDSETIWANANMQGWIAEHGELIDVFYLRTPDDFYLRIYLYDPGRNRDSDSFLEREGNVLLDHNSNNRPANPVSSGQ